MRSGRFLVRVQVGELIACGGSTLPGDVCFNDRLIAQLGSSHASGSVRGVGDRGVLLMITLRPMTDPDLSVVEAWMQQPHVARWWLEGSTLQRELEDCVRSVRGEQATNIRLVLEDGRPIGWCQWYRYSDYPNDAPAIGAALDDIGIDYAIGEPAVIGRGLGTQLVAALVEEIRTELPAAGIIVDPSAANLPSRRVLEHNGFVLVEERFVEGVLEAVYRLLPG